MVKDSSGTSAAVAAEGGVHLDEQSAAVGHLGQPNLLVDDLDDAARAGLGRQPGAVGDAAPPPHTAGKTEAREDEVRRGKVR